MVELQQDLGGYTPLLVALLCVVAIGLSASTLTNASTAMLTDVTSGPQPIVGGDQQTNQGSNSNGGAAGVSGGEDAYVDFTYCLTFLTSPLVVLGILLLYAGGLGLIVRRFSVAAGVLVGLTFVPPLSVSYFFLTNCSGGSIIGGGGGGVGSVAGGVGVSSPLPAWMVMPLVLGAVFVGAAIVLWGTTGDEEFEPESEAEAEDVDVQDIAAAAGEAADRIDTSADVDNEVFRAWKEMTDLLQISNPESSTPGEFAEAAIDAGMDRDDVMELTELFDEVRYGNIDASSEREERAVAVLRRIESAYGPAEDEEATDDASDEDGQDASDVTNPDATDETSPDENADATDDPTIDDDARDSEGDQR